MLEMSWVTAIVQLYSQVADLFWNVIVKRINIRLFDLLARFHYILNLPRIIQMVYKTDVKMEDYIIIKCFPLVASEYKSFLSKFSFFF